MLLILYFVTFVHGAFYRIKAPIENISNSENYPRKFSTYNLLSYYGGPVISSVDIVPIFYGGSQVPDSNNLIKFYNVIANSTYMDLCK